jgi:hypothetical protein
LVVDLRKADEGTMAGDLAELFLAIGSVAQDKGSGVIFLLDEVQFAKEVEYRALISGLHRATQKNMPISATAAGLPHPGLTGQARSYAERLFTFPVIAGLNEQDARAALVEPARRQGVEYEPDAVAKAQAWTRGYPYEVRIQRATAEERRYMRAMAELGEGPYRSGLVADKLARKTSEVSMTRQHLIDKGLIYATEDYGHVDFTIPRFEEFMRRHMAYPEPRRVSSSSDNLPPWSAWILAARAPASAAHVVEALETLTLLGRKGERRCAPR